MRTVQIFAVTVLLLLIALTLMPVAGIYRFNLSLAALAMTVVLLTITVTNQNNGTKSRQTKAAQPMPVPAIKNQAEAEIVSFLATLQEKGRLVDFLMDDITAYNDAQVGAAARVVHEGCRAALQEHFGILPIRSEAEGSTVTVPVGYPADEYRLVGKISGDAPFTGTLVHRGWKTGTVKLPRLLRADGNRFPAIAPAEVELK